VSLPPFDGDHRVFSDRAFSDWGFSDAAAGSAGVAVGFAGWSILSSGLGSVPSPDTGLCFSRDFVAGF
jgi:hypothetical protein